MRHPCDIRPARAVTRRAATALKAVLRIAAATAHRSVHRAPAGAAGFALAALLAVAPASGAPSGTDAPEAERVITLTPHATEMVYAAGGGEQIVGAVSASDFPEAALALPRIGDGVIVNLERIIVLKPTLIIGWQRSGAALRVEALAEKLDAKMTYSAPASLLDIPAGIREIGRLLGSDAVASAAAAGLERRIRALEERYAGQRPITVFIEVGSMPLYTIGQDPLLDDALRVCGGINIYGSSGIPAPRVPVENVLVQKPQLIVAPARRDDELRAVQSRWAGLGVEAARHGQVHGIDPDALFRPGPRFIDATESLCEALDAARRELDSTAPAGGPKMDYP
ncbi:ABC transporter substrate-binding protein [Alcaligenaceae bacterium]|nr:ABC transporter substrate-binding protein [Alcaligenaceae bacterium]